MEILYTIAPIFVIILLGWFARRRGFVPIEFFGPANRLVFYIAIPAMIFRSISRASLHREFDLPTLGITLSAVFLLFLLSWATASLIRVRHRPFLGTFVQCTVHGNLGYIGLAISFYALGEDGLVKASIFAGFIMILQNILAVCILQFYAGRPGVKGNRILMAIKIVGNPVIIASMSGMLVSALEIPIPRILDQSLQILGGMSLPLALLIIGASLNFHLVTERLVPVLGSAALKLLVMPGLGWVGFQMAGIPWVQCLPALILLAAPTATVTYVMAKEIDGDPDFAVAAISVITLLSGVTYLFWLTLVG
jgi:predicted permease